MGMMTDVAYAERGGATLRYSAAGLAFISELIHLWVLPGQFVVAMLPGIFFLLVATSQGLLAVNLLFGPGRWTLRLGILLNLFVVFVWAFTRVVSVPELFAPVRLPVEGLDLVATAAEVALVILLMRLRRVPPAQKAQAPRATGHA
jgi:isoprenylcysteine carboxyl methyltransferase (ICMT) family protein YpbQ